MLGRLAVISEIGGAREQAYAAFYFATDAKKPIRQDGLLHCLMPGSLWRASCPPPSGPLLRNVQIR
ncbi:hypothetical protein DPO65_23900, partial [Salmonella enterica subsp. salamae serovar Sofia]|nr:hypothetical protein [Salmonella enterica subsp. salamae serovar Sofia]